MIMFLIWLAVVVLFLLGLREALRGEMPKPPGYTGW